MASHLIQQVNTELAHAGLPRATVVEPLVFNPNNSATVSVDRIVLEDGGSLVRKELSANGLVTVDHWAASEHPEHWNYWCREALAYTEPGVSAAGHAVEFAADAGLRAPDLVHHELGDESAVLFLEHVVGRTGPQLTLDDHARVARTLGEAQANATGRSSAQPSALMGSGDLTWAAPTWWSREWLRQYASTRPVGIGVMSADDLWSHPTVASGFGEAAGEIHAGFAVAMGELAMWADVLAGLPQTLSHNDLWANNVICSPTGDLVIDWGCIGPAAMGVDIGTFGPDGFLNGMQLDSVHALDALMSAEYCKGLAAGGWDGPEQLVRLGVCAAVAKYCWLPALMVLNAENSGPTGYGGREAGAVVDVFRRRVPVFLWMLEMLTEARKIKEEVGA